MGSEPGCGPVPSQVAAGTGRASFHPGIPAAPCFPGCWDAPCPGASARPVPRGSPVDPGPLPVVLPGSHEEELSDRTAASRGSRRIPLHPAASRSIPVLPLLPDVPVLLEHPCTPRDPDASRAPDHPICSQGSRRSWSIPVLRRDPVPEHPSVPSASQCFFCSQNSQCTWSIPLMDPHTPSASQCSQ